MGGIGFVILGVFFLLFTSGKLSVSKNPDKNKEWRAKYGKFMYIASILLIIIGIINIIL